MTPKFKVKSPRNVCSDRLDWHWNSSQLIGRFPSKVLNSTGKSKLPSWRHISRPMRSHLSNISANSGQRSKICQSSGQSPRSKSMTSFLTLHSTKCRQFLCIFSVNWYAVPALTSNIKRGTTACYSVEHFQSMYSSSHQNDL